MHPRGPYMPHILLLACQKPRRLFPPAEPRPRPPSRPGQRPCPRPPLVSMSGNSDCRCSRRHCCRQYFSRGRHPLNPNDASSDAYQPSTVLTFPREECALWALRALPSAVPRPPPSSAHSAALGHDWPTGRAHAAPGSSLFLSVTCHNQGSKQRTHTPP